jgi:hypothetical protein
LISATLTPLFSLPKILRRFIFPAAAPCPLSAATEPRTCDMATSAGSRAVADEQAAHRFGAGPAVAGGSFKLIKPQDICIQKYAG